MAGTCIVVTHGSGRLTWQATVRLLAIRVVPKWATAWQRRLGRHQSHLPIDRSSAAAIAGTRTRKPAELLNGKRSRDPVTRRQAV
jgi:hypothetical protein